MLSHVTVPVMQSDYHDDYPDDYPIRTSDLKKLIILQSLNKNKLFYSRIYWIILK